MKSVSDQLLGEGATKAIVDAGITTPDEGLVRMVPVDPSKPVAPADPQALGRAKLRVAMATRDHHAAPKSSGVHFVSGTNGQNVKQVQMIFDDGSVRNPYKKARISGRQRRKMCKEANRNMRARGITSNLRDVLKGRQGEPVSPPQETPNPETPSQ
jgi:hypothetical protein